LIDKTGVATARRPSVVVTTPPPSGDHERCDRQNHGDRHRQQPPTESGLNGSDSAGAREERQRSSHGGPVRLGLVLGGSGQVRCKEPASNRVLGNPSSRAFTGLGSSPPAEDGTCEAARSCSLAINSLTLSLRDCRTCARTRRPARRDRPAGLLRVGASGAEELRGAFRRPGRRVLQPRSR